MVARRKDIVMKMTKIKRIIVSMLLVCTLALTTAFVAGAVNATNSGTRTHGSGAYINWTFYSEGSGSRMSSCKFTRLAPSTGVSVTDQHRIGYDPSEAYGYVKATLYGSTWLPSNTVLAWHTISNNAITVHKG